MEIRLFETSDAQAWDSYVNHHPCSTHCHLSGWKNVIEMTYGHKGYYLIAENASTITGILPLVHIRSVFFGSQLVSMPFLNYGGVLADSAEAENTLMKASVELAARLKASAVELRQQHPLNGSNAGTSVHFAPTTDRVTMLLALLDSPEALFQSLRSKLRSQIRRPQKEGMTFSIGGQELLNDFYAVFSVNMRDLGSPVHSKKLFNEIMTRFPQTARLGIVRHGGEPAAAGLILGFRDTIEIPWASALRKYNPLSPNMLLYWSFLEYGCVERYRYFDFGRTTVGKGTYKFKEQWGAHPKELYWCACNVYHRPITRAARRPKLSQQTLMSFAASAWRLLPVFLTNLVGPRIRRFISL